MKKLIALILCLAILVPCIALPVTAEEPTAVVQGTLDSAFAEGKDSLIVFVTGIGQSRSYLFDEKYLEPDAFENGDLQDFENYAPLIAQGETLDCWNLFKVDFDFVSIVQAVRLLAEIVLSICIGRYHITDNTVRDLVKALFKYNIVDEEGNLPDRVVSPRYVCPVSEYPSIIDENGEVFSEAKRRFYSSIPCAEVAEEKLGANFEDYIYCYNYPTFSDTAKNVKGLHDFIETIIAENKHGADEVVLVPMSMGASVVSSYLYDYPQREDNHVLRVVSIVGCWNGSDLVTDLVTGNYAENSADLFYKDLMPEVFGGAPLGNVLIGVLRFFHKADLRRFIDQALNAVCEEVFLHTPSLATALTPCYDYDLVKDHIIYPSARKQADKYNIVQSTVKERMADLEAQGITFSFVSGYGLPYGAMTSDYTAFGFMDSAAKTNSDEIINISSTCPGTQFVPYNETFEDTEGRILSPDGSIDISTSYYKDSSWFFYGQKHELEYNNTALALAIELALGNVKTVSDCDSPDDDYYYPQFNDARNLKQLNNDMKDLEVYCAQTGYVLTADQQAVYDKAVAMKKSTVNDFEKDNAVIDEFRNMLIEIGIKEAETTDKTEETLISIVSFGDMIINKIFGSKGYFD